MVSKTRIAMIGIAVIDVLAAAGLSVHPNPTPEIDSHAADHGWEPNDDASGDLVIDDIGNMIHSQGPHHDGLEHNVDTSRDLAIDDIGNKHIYCKRNKCGYPCTESCGKWRNRPHCKAPSWVVSNDDDFSQNWAHGTITENTSTCACWGKEMQMSVNGLYCTRDERAQRNGTVAKQIDEPHVFTNLIPIDKTQTAQYCVDDFQEFDNSSLPFSEEFSNVSSLPPVASVKTHQCDEDDPNSVPGRNCSEMEIVYNDEEADSFDTARTYIRNCTMVNTFPARKLPILFTHEVTNSFCNGYKEAMEDYKEYSESTPDKDPNQIDGEVTSPGDMPIHIVTVTLYHPERRAPILTHTYPVDICGAEGNGAFIFDTFTGFNVGVIEVVVTTHETKNVHPHWRHVESRFITGTQYKTGIQILPPSLIPPLPSTSFLKAEDEKIKNNVKLAHGRRMSRSNRTEDDDNCHDDGTACTAVEKTDGLPQHFLSPMTWGFRLYDIEFNMTGPVVRRTALLMLHVCIQSPACAYEPNADNGDFSGYNLKTEIKFSGLSRYGDNTHLYTLSHTKKCGLDAEEDDEWIALGGLREICVGHDACISEIYIAEISGPAKTKITEVRASVVFPEDYGQQPHDTVGLLDHIAAPFSPTMGGRYHLKTCPTQIFGNMHKDLGKSYQQVHKVGCSDTELGIDRWYKHVYNEKVIEFAKDAVWQLALFTALEVVTEGTATYFGLSKGFGSHAITAGFGVYTGGKLVQDIRKKEYEAAFADAFWLGVIVGIHSYSYFKSTAEREHDPNFPNLSEEEPGICKSGTETKIGVCIRDFPNCAGRGRRRMGEEMGGLCPEVSVASKIFSNAANDVLHKLSTEDIGSGYEDVFNDIMEILDPDPAPYPIEETFFVYNDLYDVTEWNVRARRPKADILKKLVKSKKRPTMSMVDVVPVYTVDLSENIEKIEVPKSGWGKRLHEQFLHELGSEIEITRINTATSNLKLGEGDMPLYAENYEEVIDNKPAAADVLSGPELSTMSTMDWWKKRVANMLKQLFYWKTELPPLPEDMVVGAILDFVSDPPLKLKKGKDQFFTIGMRLREDGKTVDMAAWPGLGPDLDHFPNFEHPSTFRGTPLNNDGEIVDEYREHAIPQLFAKANVNGPSQMAKVIVEKTGIYNGRYVGMGMRLNSEGKIVKFQHVYRINRNSWVPDIDMDFHGIDFDPRLDKVHWRIFEKIAQFVIEGPDPI